MKFFISHASQHKPTIKMILEKMPLNIKTWLDEEKLIWGSDLQPTFENAIKENSDFVILFISESSAKSAWVQKEVSWALEKEKKYNRTIILPICIQSGEENVSILFPQLGNRKKLILDSFDELGLTKFAKDLSNYLFYFICNELNEVYSPTKTTSLKTINNADTIIIEYAHLIQGITFYHRKNNPITIDELYKKILEKKQIDYEPFTYILEQVSLRGLIPGLYFDGFELYLEEEHMAWKKEFNRSAKINVAKKAASLVKNNMRIYIDAGSTAFELVKILCNRITSNNLYNLTITTISISQANAIAECCVNKGFDDMNSGIRLEILGGLLRPNTEAIVPINNSQMTSEPFDIAFIGVNGATKEGFSILNNPEVRRKKEAFALGKRKVLLCDASKCGILLEELIATKDSDFEVIMNEDSNNEKFRIVAEEFKDKLNLARGN